MPDTGESAQDPSQFNMLRHLRLVVEKRPLGIHTGSQDYLGQIGAFPTEVGRIIRCGHCVEVHYAVDRVVLVLHANPVAQGADHVPYMRVTGGLHARENSFLVSHTSGPRSQKGAGLRRRHYDSRVSSARQCPPSRSTESPSLPSLERRNRQRSRQPESMAEARRLPAVSYSYRRAR